MKCDICKKKVEETFLKKIKGTFVKVSGKRKVVCSECQKLGKMKELTTK